MSDNFFKIKNGLNLPTVSSDPTAIAPAANPAAGDMVFYNGSLYKYNGTSWNLIVNADIAANAAIDGTKITPNFGSQTIRTTTKLEVSANTSAEAVIISQIGSGNALVVEDSANPDTTSTIIDASGNVGIGVAANASLTDKLTVVGAIGTDTIKARTSSGLTFQEDGGTPTMVITDAGNVGIGTSSPSSYGHGGTNKFIQVENSNTTTNAQAHYIINSGFNSTGVSALGTVSWALPNVTATEKLSAYIGAVTESGHTLAAPNVSLVFASRNGVGVATERMRIDASGNLLVGTTTLNVISANTTGLSLYGGSSSELMIAKAGPTIELSRLSTTGAVQYFYYNNANIAGNISINSASTVGYNQGSDERLKENIRNADSAIEHIKAMQVRSFDWKSDKLHNKYGFIAQELVKIADYAVFIPSNPDEMMGVDFGKLVPALVKCAQEQQAMIESMKAEIEALKAK